MHGRSRRCDPVGIATDAPPDRPRDRTGTELAGRYRLSAALAAGGMAEVWQADDLVLGRQVAVKILHPHLATDPAFVERFRAEAIAAARLAHPGIVAVYDTVTEPGTEAIVMELLRGVTLRQFLDQYSPLAVADAIDVGVQVTEALEEAHRNGIVHRDIKPGNVMLCDDRRVKVTDFGIAKASAQGDLTVAGSLVGTAKYLAPEQVEGEPVDGRADLYSLGIMLYEMLCGRVPFVGDTDVATATARLSQDPPRPRQIRATLPARVDEVVMRAMARRRDDRYEDAAAMRSALLEAADGPAVADGASAGTGRLDPVEPSGFAATERRWLVPAGLIALVATSLVLAGLLIGRTDTGRDIFRNARDVVGLPVDEPVDDPPAEVVAEAVISAVTPFDPEGSGTPGENDTLAPLASDGDPVTVWRTESYDSRAFGELKSGVGLIITLEAALPVDRLLVRSPTTDWAAEVYVAGAAAAQLDGWGTVVTRAEAIAGDVEFELGGVEGRAILLWITDLGDGPPRVRVEIGEVIVDAG